MSVSVQKAASEGQEKLQETGEEVTQITQKPVAEAPPTAPPSGEAEGHQASQAAGIADDPCKAKGQGEHNLSGTGAGGAVEGEPEHGSQQKQGSQQEQGSQKEGLFTSAAKAVGSVFGVGGGSQEEPADPAEKP